MPIFDPQGGAYLIRETIGAVESLPVDAATRGKIFGGNLSRLLRLDER